VKVEPKWRQSRSLLAEFGYRTEEWRERGIMNYELSIINYELVSGKRELWIMKWGEKIKIISWLLKTDFWRPTSEDRLLKTDGW
jgi:hypothetical protein